MSSRPSDNPAASQEAVFRFLSDPRTHGLSEPVRRVDTAGAVVFLAGPDAYKVKRAVTFPFMDLATLEKRRSACEAEIAVNRASAPEVYLAALPITRSGERLAIGGEGEIVEWVTHMRRFDEKATLDHIAARDGLSNETIDKLTLAIRRSHARAPLQGCGALGPFARDLYRPERRRIRRAPRSFRPGESPAPDHRFATRFRGGAADPLETRGKRFHPPLSRRSAPGQHCHAQRRTDFV